jgi:hypothetical protein
MLVCRVDACHRRFDDDGVAPLGYNAAGGNPFSLDTACRLQATRDWQGRGLSWWRWLVFAAMWWPLGFVGHLLARIIAAIASASFATSNVRYAHHP